MDINLDTYARYANITRYLSGAGLVALVYDHILTLPSEIILIWPAPSSYAKYIFLVNRYLVPASLLAIAWEMTHFRGSLSNETCQSIFSTIAMLSILSLGLANILVLMWVVSLWDKNRTVVWMLTFGFIVSAGTSSSMMIASLVEVAESVIFLPSPLSMCIVTRTTPKFVVVWGAPMVFEILVLVATWWNSLSVPREANMPLRTALHRDGVTFFIVLTLFRSLNLSLSATRRPELVLMTVFLVWSMTTLVLNRSLLRLQRAENLQLVLNELIEQEFIRHHSCPGSRFTAYSNFGTTVDSRSSLQRWDSKKASHGEEFELYRLG